MSNALTTDAGQQQPPAVASSVLLAELDTIRCRLFDIANSQAGNDKGNAACLLHSASSEIVRAMKCIERGNPKDEPIPPHLLAQSLGIFG